MEFAELLAIVAVDREQRVTCQAQGCGHAVYRAIHVVRHDGEVHVYGSDCFLRLFAGVLIERARSLSGSEAPMGRMLTAEERQLLVENTEALIARFEGEVESAQETAFEDAQYARRQARIRLEADRERYLELLSRARADIRERMGVDPDLPGFRGLVAIRARELDAQDRAMDSEEDVEEIEGGETAGKDADDDCQGDLF